MRALTVAFFLSLTSIAQTTCLDPLACNFTEIGDCVYLDIDGLTCVTEGCAIPGACNFDPEADINDGSCEFTSCLGCTDETACNFEPEALYLDLSCIYFVDCNGVCGGDWIEDDCGNCFPVEVESVIYTFETCGAEGRFGPSQEQLNQEYGAGSGVTVIDGIQHWTVPTSGTYRIEAWGAEGGNEDYNIGGSGARMSGYFMLTSGQTIKIIVGQMGINGYNKNTYWGSTTNNDGGGGGGGSFVVSIENIPYIVAGGGGGRVGAYGGSTYHGNITTEGGDTYENGGGNDGNGGNNGILDGEASGGGGFYSNGQNSNNGCCSTGGLSFLNGGIGGYDTGAGGYFGGDGGFGGGGAGWHNNVNRCGGGGGYSGGQGGTTSGQYNGGGGGSFISENATLISAESGVNEGHGLVVIEFISTQAPECQLGCIVEQACNFNPEATNDDGTCDFCFCGPGTAWDNLSEQCLIVEGSSDIDGDGCTNLSDLLDLLSDYGICDE
jgi:hypothetical protein